MSFRIAFWVSLPTLALACSTTVTTFGPETTGAGAGGSTSEPSSSGMGGAGAGGSTGNNTSSGTQHFGACNENAACVLAEPGCCAGCGAQTLDDMEPINRANEQAFFDATCAEDIPACPECVPAVNPELFAHCETGQCLGVDVATAAWNQCTADADCTLRVGTDCCESCSDADPTNLIAVPLTGGDIEALVCDFDGGCPPCAPQYPKEATAMCMLGSCRVAWAVD